MCIVMPDQSVAISSLLAGSESALRCWTSKALSEIVLFSITQPHYTLFSSPPKNLFSVDSYISIW